MKVSMRFTLEDLQAMRELAACLGAAARRDGMPKRYTRTEVVRVAVRTMLNQFVAAEQRRQDCLACDIAE